MSFFEGIFAFLFRERFLIELICASFLFVWGEKRRRLFLLRAAGFLILSLLIGFMWNETAKDYLALSIFRYLFLFSSLIFAIWLCFEIDFFKALFYATGSLATQHVAYLVYGLLPAPYEMETTALTFGILFLQILLTAAVWTGLYFLFIRRLKAFNIKQDVSLLLFNLIILLCDIILSIVGSNGETNVFSSHLIRVYDLLLTFFAFFYLYGSLQKNAIKAEHALQKQLMEQEKRQFEELKQSVQGINIKCHDLRHQIANHGQFLDKKEYVRELSASVSVYDSYIDTGNETLDIILMDKKLRCNTLNIPFTIIAEANDLSFMAAMDIYSLFGNTIENAMEYLITVPEEKRLIRMNCKTVNTFFSIRIENYYEEKLKLENGLPVTTKKEKELHGFGMKSIEQIVKKYDGGMTIAGDNKLFSLNIVFPLGK